MITCFQINIAQTIETTTTGLTPGINTFPNGLQFSLNDDERMKQTLHCTSWLVAPGEGRKVTGTP